MSYSEADLKAKLLELYPEITENALSLSLNFDEELKAWIVSFEKQNQKRHAILDKKDADACLEGNACIYLGMLIPQYLKDIEAALAK
jgi:hypothetical protein